MLAWGEAPGKFGTCLDGFSQVINLLCELTEFRLFGNGHISLLRLMDNSKSSLRSVPMSFLCGILLTHI